MPLGLLGTAYNLWQGLPGGHTGNMGLKDRSVTEFVSDKMGMERTDQGGSNLFGGNQKSAMVSPAQQQSFSNTPIGPQKPSGNVLGANTTGSTGTTLTGGGGTPTQPPTVEETNSGGGNPGDPFAHINSIYDNAMGNFAGRQAEANQNLRNLASTRKQGIQQQLQNQLPQYDTFRTQQKQQTAKTLADLAADLRNSSQNVMNYLGGRGAGNTSAVDHAAFALSKEFGRNRADVQQQLSGQLAEIDLAEQNLKTSADEMMNEVDTWLDSNIAQIASEFDNARGQLDMAKANQMLEYLQQMESQANALKSQLISQAQNRLASLNDYRLQLQQSGAFNPQDIVAQEFSGINGGLMDQANMLTNSVFGRRNDDERLV